MQTLDVGEIATLTSLWWNGANQASEPSAITLVFHLPDGTDLTVNKSSMQGTSSGAPPPGVLDQWSYGQPATLAGLWRYDLSGVVDGAPVEKPSGSYLVGGTLDAGPCEPWCTWADVERCGGNFASVTNAQREAVIDTASSILYDLSDRLYSGVCEVTMSLCLACVPCCGYGWRGSGGYGGCCHCAPWDRIDLGSPTWAVWDVWMDGVPFTNYKLLDRRWLVRTDGQSWPRFSDVSDPTKFAASWAFGRPVPAGGRAAAAQLAREMALACVGAECQLPQRVTSMTREGISFAILDPFNMVNEGRTGVYLVDLWLAADAKGRRPPPTMFAPGAHPGERTLI